MYKVVEGKHSRLFMLPGSLISGSQVKPEVARRLELEIHDCFGRNSIDKVLHREFIKAGGKDLREAATVQILLKDVLHTMLGGFSRAVQRLPKWKIHGDVNTSVLLLAQPETRRTDNLLRLEPEQRQLPGKCLLGMLVDDNQGIKERALFDTIIEVSERLNTRGPWSFRHVRSSPPSTMLSSSFGPSAGLSREFASDVGS
ncbi:hypothetical protein IW262DRAFT_1517248 [Armillaria fumosa]|nr:hypothetical protein IW262DRAFT_1517248 [Armillaria fumosa]